MTTYKYTDATNTVVHIIDEDGISRSSCIASSLPEGTEILPADPPVVTVPVSVSPRQIRQALTRFNLRNEVEYAISQADLDTQDWYKYATEFRRDHPAVAALASALAVTSEQLDQLWTLAYSL